MTKKKTNTIIESRWIEGLDLVITGSQEVKDRALGQLVRAVMAYDCSGDAAPVPEPDEAIFPVFAMIRPFLDDRKEHYVQRCAVNAVNAATKKEKENKSETKRSNKKSMWEE